MPETLFLFVYSLDFANKAVYVTQTQGKKNKKKKFKDILWRLLK